MYIDSVILLNIYYANLMCFNYQTNLLIFSHTNLTKLKYKNISMSKETKSQDNCSPFPLCALPVLPVILCISNLLDLNEDCCTQGLREQFSFFKTSGLGYQQRKRESILIFKEY